jgi:DNA-binding IclR family transcriptional regulator
MDMETKTETESAAAAEERSSNRTLSKGLLLLSLFDMEHPDWSLRELREQSGFPKTTTIRLVKTLEAHGYLSCNAPTGRYHLGPSILKSAYVSFSHSELVRVAHPLLEALTKETTETSGLTVWTELGPLLVDVVFTDRLFKPHLWLGMTLPGLGSAAARVLLAFNEGARMEKALSAGETARTPFTVTDRDLLRDELIRVRRDGVSFELQEWDLSMGAVAAPVLGGDGLSRASLAVVVPIERCGDAEMHAYTEAVKRVAGAISRELGSIE